MPIPYFDFTKSPLQRRDTSPYQSMLSGALGGYQQGQQFKQQGQQFQQEQEKRALSNEEQSMLNNLMKLYGKEKEEANLAHTKAMTAHHQRLASDDRMGSMRAINPNAVTREQREWQSMPANVRNDYIATLVGSGKYSVDEAAHLGATGVKLRDALGAQNIEEINSIDKVFSPTNSSITQQQTQDARGAGLDVLEKLVSEWGGKHRIVGGHSPKLIYQMISGDSEDEQAKFLAQRAVQPELAGGRAALATGSNSHSALKEIQEKSLGNSKIFQSLVSPSVYRKTQHYINFAIQKENDARRRKLYNIKSPKNENSNNPISELSQEEFDKLDRETK